MEFLGVIEFFDAELLYICVIEPKDGIGKSHTYHRKAQERVQQGTGDSYIHRYSGSADRDGVQLTTLLLEAGISHSTSFGPDQALAPTT